MVIFPFFSPNRRRMRITDPPSRQVVQRTTFPAFVCYGHSPGRVVCASCKCIDTHGRGIVFIMDVSRALSSISDSTIVFSINCCYCLAGLTITASTGYERIQLLLSTGPGPIKEHGTTFERFRRSRTEQQFIGEHQAATFPEFHDS